MIFDHVLMLNEQEQKIERFFKFHIIWPSLGQYMLEHLRVVSKTFFIWKIYVILTYTSMEMVDARFFQMSTQSELNGFADKTNTE